MSKKNLLEKFEEFLEENFGGSTDNHKEHIESETSIVKSKDEMERRALFVVLEPQDSLDSVKDHHQDYYDEITIEKACIDYNLHCRAAGMYHKYVVESDVVSIEQSFITPTSFTTEEGVEIKKGSWLVWTHFPEPLDKEDDLWPQVLSGDINGVSVECTGLGYQLDE